MFMAYAIFVLLDTTKCPYFQGTLSSASGHGGSCTTEALATVLEDAYLFKSERMLA